MYINTILWSTTITLYWLQFYFSLSSFAKYVYCSRSYMCDVCV